MRDVTAAHILKASYAIQDTAQTVAKHYGRFLSKGKAALAAHGASGKRVHRGGR